MSKARAAKKNFRNQHSAGTFKGHKPETLQKWKESASKYRHSDETKQRIKEKALSSSHRRLRKGIVEYKGIILDSSWELALAKRLDFLGLSWIRPEPIKWVDEDNVVHNYFPDFYLIDYDLYLDPKNPAAMAAQNKKVSILKEQVKNLVFLQTLDECNNFTI